MNFASLKMVAAAGIATVMMAGSALAVPVFSSSDAIWGGQKVGDSFMIGGPGTVGKKNNWPGNESPDHAIDGVGQKYLNFAKENSGLVITASDSFVVDSLQLWTANDFAGRDPASYALYGTNALLSGTAGSFALSAFDLISSGSLALPTARNADGTTVLSDAASQTITFLNLMAFNSYMILFPTLKDSKEIAVQIAEVQLFGTKYEPEQLFRTQAVSEPTNSTPVSPVPLPAAGLLLFGSLFAFGFARRRA